MLNALKPNSNPKLMDLLKEANFNVSDWGKFNGGESKAASNPKYCYDWSFEQDGNYLFNIWFEKLIEEDGDILQRLNFRENFHLEKGPRKSRLLKFDLNIIDAFEISAHPRVVILQRNPRKKLLDPSPWTIRSYNFETGAFELVRGIEETATACDAELNDFVEGELRKRMVRHRLRENKAREAKISQFRELNGGQLFCEVPRCGFNFSIVYGQLGEGYAHVHHKIPLSQAPAKGMVTILEDLLVVCANCHAMIHRGGDCREIEDLIPSSES